jgi:hypothetical protein
MALEDVTSLLKNIKGGPKTTIAGAFLTSLSVYTMYTNGFNDTYTSVHVGMLAVGIYLFVINDKLKIKNDENTDG